MRSIFFVLRLLLDEMQTFFRSVVKAVPLSNPRPPLVRKSKSDEVDILTRVDKWSIHVANAWSPPDPGHVTCAGDSIT